MTSPQQHTDLGRALVHAADAEKITLRLIGGVAVYMTCPSIATHPSLQRPIKDLDFVAPRSDFAMLDRFFPAQGAKLKSKQADEWTFEKDGIEIEVTVPDFRENHRIDLGPRLALASPTVPLVDLLLIKLQRAPFAEKDIQDSLALLLDHPFETGRGAEQMNPLYIARLCSRAWGLFTTIYDNTVTLEKVMDRYLQNADARLAWQRLEAIQQTMDEQPKSLSWMINQLIHRPSQVPS